VRRKESILEKERKRKKGKEERKERREYFAVVDLRFKIAYRHILGSGAA
jgi:hypothetical protein